MDGICSKVQFFIETKAGKNGVRRESVQVSISLFSGDIAQEWFHLVH